MEEVKRTFNWASNGDDASPPNEQLVIPIWVPYYFRHEMAHFIERERDNSHAGDLRRSDSTIDDNLERSEIVLDLNGGRAQCANALDHR